MNYMYTCMSILHRKCIGGGGGRGQLLSLVFSGEFEETLWHDTHVLIGLKKERYQGTHFMGLGPQVSLPLSPGRVCDTLVRWWQPAALPCPHAHRPPRSVSSDAPTEWEGEGGGEGGGGRCGLVASSHMCSQVVKES